MTTYRLPVPHVDGKYNVSFSGLKTAVLNEVNKAQMKGEEVNVPDLAASFQERIAGILAEKLLLAAADTGAKQVCLAGGVAVRLGTAQTETPLFFVFEQSYS